MTALPKASFVQANLSLDPAQLATRRLRFDQPAGSAVLLDRIDFSTGASDG